MVEDTNNRPGGSKPRVVLLLSGGIVAGLMLLVWLNRDSSLPPSEAEHRIRLLLSRSVTQNYAGRFNDDNTLDYDLGLKLQRELKEVNTLIFESIEIKKLLPDYLLRPHRSTYIVKVELGNEYSSESRYFWLPSTSIDRETTETAWYFSL